MPKSFVDPEPTQLDAFKSFETFTGVEQMCFNAFSFKFSRVPVDNPWSHPLVKLQTNFSPSGQRNTKMNRPHPALWTIWMPEDLTCLDYIQPLDDSRHNSAEFVCQKRIEEVLKNGRSVKKQITRLVLTGFQQISKYLILYARMV